MKITATSRTRAFIAVLVIAVVIAGVVVVAGAMGPKQEPAPLPSERTAAAGDGPWRNPRGASPSGSASLPPSPDPASSASPAAGLSSDPRAVELCGMGWTVPPEGGGDSPYPPAQTRLVDEWLERGLREHPDPKARAVLAFGFNDEAEAAALARARDEVVRAAARGQDPALYQMALDLCSRSLGKTPACQLVSARHYVQLDPGNAHGWLLMAGEAVERGDAAGLDEALFQAARSPRYDERSGLYAVASMTILPEEAPGWARQVLLLRGFGLQAATPQPWLGAVVKHCAPAALRDANRRQQCDALAHLFVDRGRSLSALMLGATIARKLGWPADEVRRLEDEHRLAVALAVSMEPEGRRMLGCAAHSAFRDWVGSVQVHGEREAARQRWAASGRPAAELIRHSDDRMAGELQRFRLERREAAASASSPGVP